MKNLRICLSLVLTVLFLNTGSLQAQGKDDDNPKNEKKGMSKKGKGAIIGGGAGAVGGAIIGGKKGAVIGGAAGTVGGAAVGKKKDKKKDPERYEQYSDKKKKD
ncbi:hypothetical protein I5M27_11470 [Adhaeribacter sp. BT258]|uniref:YMGG-like Gly-zipper domain-containing protein n=1 Tax=Adhaeribacter terrigena TaxID=2793070 RepID=A0ABS1C2I6_9BACT|nr:YMGG-like glycine zipper-containing protein [Adhaeribacter terrigena]MBK0403609.1 hypothetical protein [Adhaeribacter terrigena]